LGVVIALDDSGPAYSSLSYLHSFPFDLIKIDRAFVSDLMTNRHSMAIVRAVIGLGRSLGVPVLAEGVETEQQREFLLEVGCSAIQGYLQRQATAGEVIWTFAFCHRARRPCSCSSPKLRRAWRASLNVSSDYVRSPASPSGVQSVPVPMRARPL